MDIDHEKMTPPYLRPVHTFPGRTVVATPGTSLEELWGTVNELLADMAGRPTHPPTDLTTDDALATWTALGDLVDQLLPHRYATMIWDLRVTQANVAQLPAATLHSLEHFFNVYFRETNAGIPLVAPLGCLTGLYIVAHNIDDFDVMAELVAGALHHIIDSTTVPVADYVHCGSADMHDLGAAQRTAQFLLRERASWADCGPVLAE